MIDTAIIEQCKNPSVSTEVVQKIIRVESGYRSLIINVNGKAVMQFYSKEAAIKQAEKEVKEGNSVDLGLMQINSKNLNNKNFGIYSIADMFNTCKNIKLGSTIFYLAYQNTPSGELYQTRIKKALSIYNTGNAHKGFSNGYVAKYKEVQLSPYQRALSSTTKINLNYDLYNLTKEAK